MELLEIFFLIGGIIAFTVGYFIDKIDFKTHKK